MATPTPVRALLRQSTRFSSSHPQPLRCLHITARRLEGKTTRHTAVGPLPKTRNPAEKPPKWVREAPEPTISGKEAFPQYTEQELAILRTKYTSEQMEAIQAGESAIDPQDLMNQGVARNDYMRVHYLDDFSRINPVLDKKRMAPDSNVDPNWRYKTDEELDEDVTRFVDEMPEDADTLDWMKFEENLRMTVGKEEAERQPIDYLAPTLPKLTDPLVKRVAKMEGQDTEQKNAKVYTILARRTGLGKQYMRALRTKVMSEHRVVNQTRMGKIQSQYKLVIAGNGAGLIGIGEGKHAEDDVALEQATLKAIANMKPVLRYEDRTIYGDVRGKVSGSVVELFSRPPGFGLRCQERIYEVMKCCGISDLAAKTLRSSNPMNVIKATVQALQKQRHPEDVARGRGRKMIDVRKVYYAGAN